MNPTFGHMATISPTRGFVAKIRNFISSKSQYSNWKSIIIIIISQVVYQKTLNFKKKKKWKYDAFPQPVTLWSESLAVFVQVIAVSHKLRLNTRLNAHSLSCFILLAQKTISWTYDHLTQLSGFYPWGAANQKTAKMVLKRGTTSMQFKITRFWTVNRAKSLCQTWLFTNKLLASF